MSTSTPTSSATASCFGNLFRRDLQAKYRGSALGVLWTLANPLLLMGVYLLVFAPSGSRVLDAATTRSSCSPASPSGRSSPTSLQSPTRSMLDNANLIRKMRFPRQLVPLSVVARSS